MCTTMLKKYVAQIKTETGNAEVYTFASTITEAKRTLENRYGERLLTINVETKWKLLSTENLL